MSLTFADCGEAIGNATSVVRNNAAAAGLAARVPTCPGWRVSDLVRHLGVMHRWVSARLQGGPAHRDDAQLALTLPDFADPLDWLDEGVIELLNALTKTPVDAPVPPELPNAPVVARQAWARQVAHETTIHAVDAMAARLGAAPAANQLWFKAPLAVDGIDELLTGYAMRPASPLRQASPSGLSVDAGTHGWTITWAGGDIDVRDWVDSDAPAGITGSPVGLYLALWNRGSQFERTGSVDTIALVRRAIRS